MNVSEFELLSNVLTSLAVNFLATRLWLELAERVRAHHERLVAALTPEQWSMWSAGWTNGDDSLDWHEVHNTVSGYMDYEETVDEMTAAEKSEVRERVLASLTDADKHEMATSTFDPDT